MTTATETKPTEAAKPAKEAKAPAPPTFCKCGCGEQTNPNRSFKQGHDQKLIARLAKNLVEENGTEFGFDTLPEAWAVEDMRTRIDRASRVVADRFGDGLVAKFESAAGNRLSKALRRRTREDKKVMKKDGNQASGTDDATPADDTEPVVLGAKIRVKIGTRSKVYDAEVVGMSQAGKATLVKYATASGEKQTDNFTVVN